MNRLNSHFQKSFQDQEDLGKSLSSKLVSFVVLASFIMTSKDSVGCYHCCCNDWCYNAFAAVMTAAVMTAAVMPLVL